MSNKKDIKEDQEKTDHAMKYPQVGDRFTEMCSFWLYVVAVEGDSVTTMEATGPCEFPKDGKVKKQNAEEFRRRFAYGSIPGYWVTYCDGGNDVEGWI
jgi:hypothetical protein